MAMKPDDEKAEERAEVANPPPEPENAGVKPAQREGRSVVAEVLAKKDDHSVELSVHPLLAAISEPGVRSVALGILQYLLGELSRKEEELRAERSRNSELETQLRAEQTARVRAEKNTAGLQRTRKLNTALILFGSILLGLAGFSYSTNPMLAIALALIDIVMTGAGIFL
jgi:hypothetical protein